MWLSGLLSAVCFSIMSAIIAHYGTGLSASEFLLGRSLVGLIALAPFVLFSQTNTKLSLLLLLRGVIGTMAIIILFIMIQNVGAGTATAIHYTSPIYITVLSAIFLKERVTIQKLFALTLVIFGVLIPVFDKIGDLPFDFLILGILGAALSGVSFFLLKLMTEKVSEIFIYFMFCFVQLVTQIILNYFSSNSVFHINYKTVFSSVGLPCLVVGVLACVAQLLMNNSFKKLSATTASLLNLMGIPFTVIIEYFIFNHHYDRSQYLMITMIFMGIVFLRVGNKINKVNLKLTS